MPYSCYHFSYTHVLHPGTEVVEVKATDADDNTTANGDLRYSLTQRGDFGAFDINSINGRPEALTPDRMVLSCSRLVFS